MKSLGTVLSPGGMQYHACRQTFGIIIISQQQPPPKESPGPAGASGGAMQPNFGKPFPIFLTLLPLALEEP